MLNIDGNVSDYSAATFRRHGLGLRKAFARVDLQWQADLAAFVLRLGPHIDALRTEMLRDDAITGTFDPLYEGAQSHPDFAGCMELEEHAQLAILNTYLGADLLALFFEEENSNPSCRWLAVNDEFTALTLSDGIVTITGKAVSLD